MLEIDGVPVMNRTYPELLELAREHKESYLSADPFPSGSFDEFFNPVFLDQVLEEFPNLGDEKDINYKTPNEIKLASRGESKFGPKTKKFMHFLNSEPFLDFLSEITGIKNIIPDPNFEGGGCHQINKGGFLKVHADFNKHKKTGLDRRLNFLIYLNKDWDESYGGHFELWNEDMTKCRKKILPLFNRVAMFNTTDFSYHGHPDPLTCPDGRSRKSLALYYYTNGRPIEEVNLGLEDHTTLFVDRKGNKTEKSMRRYNKLIGLATDLLPPIVTKTIKRMRNK